MLEWAVSRMTSVSGLAGLDLPQDVQAVAVGQLVVEQHQVHTAFAKAFERVRSGPRFQNPITFVLKPACKRPSNQLFVVDDEDRGGRHQVVSVSGATPAIKPEPSPWRQRQVDKLCQIRCCEAITARPMKLMAPRSKVMPPCGIQNLTIRRTTRSSNAKDTLSNATARGLDVVVISRCHDQPIVDRDHARRRPCGIFGRGPFGQ